MNLFFPLRTLLMAGGIAVASAATIQVEPLPNPATKGATAPSVMRGGDGIVRLTWLQPRGAETALQVAAYDSAAGRWREAVTVASGTNWFVNWADLPTVAFGPDGRGFAVWYVNNATAAPAHGAGHHGPGYHALLSETTDAGKTWGGPGPLTKESTAVEFVSLAPLSDGRFLAAWLDGRAKSEGKTTQQLYARLLGTPEADRLVDASVCDCCPTSLTPFLDGSALLAYRGRGDNETRDIRVTRFRGGQWEESRDLNADGWRIAGCPVNGPQLTSDGGRVAAAWFTAADGTPRVLATTSPDAGRRFFLPLRIDGGEPAGRVSTLLLRNSTMIVTWVGGDGTLWLRRVTPDFTPSDPVSIGGPGSVPLRSTPRAALVTDYAGDKTVAEILITFPSGGEPSARELRTVRVRVPEGDLLEAEKKCECAPPADQLMGYPIRGTVVSIDRDHAIVRIKHPEVPGIFPPGERTLRVAPELAAATVNGREFLGRIDRRAGEWWLFGVRWVMMPR